MVISIKDHFQFPFSKRNISCQFPVRERGIQVMKNNQISHKCADFVNLKETTEFDQEKVRAYVAIGEEK